MSNYRCSLWTAARPSSAPASWACGIASGGVVLSARLAIVGADGAWQERIARYVSISDGNGDSQRTGADDERPAGANEADEKHLLFVPTARGYLLVERDGPPPAAFRELTVPGHEGMFRVVKVSSSPLPNDSRVCAYVEQTR